METANLGRKLAVFVIDWLYFFHIGYGASLLIIIFTSGTKPNLITVLLIWLVFIILYYPIMFWLREENPRIHLYEKGVEVFNQRRKEIWTWNQLTHYTGTRHTIHMNMMPWMKEGENRFYAGVAEAFRVPATMGQADILFEYMLSRIVEKDIPALEETIRAGNQVELGGITLNLEGIGGVTTFYQWELIQRLHIRHENAEKMSVDIKIKNNPFAIKIAYVTDLQAYTLLGLVDAINGSKYLPNIQKTVEDSRSRVIKIILTDFWSLLTTLGIVLVSIMLVFFTL